MHYTNLHFTYIFTYLLTYLLVYIYVHFSAVIIVTVVCMTPDVELRVEPSVGKIATQISFTAVLHPNVRNNINSFVFSYGDGSRLQTSFDSSTTHMYRKHGM